MGLIARHAERVTGAVLIGLHPGIGEEDRTARIAWDDSQAEQLTSTPLASFVDAWQALPIFDSQQGLADDVLATQRIQRLDHTSEGLSWAMHTLGLGRMPCYREALLSTSVPVTLVAGERDPKFCSLARELGLALEVVPGVGHNVVLEAPEALRSIMLRDPHSARPHAPGAHQS
jgi:2-succinyl-6-hydroxy-2,4-cyclohexadiene-1-carboxylate synthase